MVQKRLVSIVTVNLDDKLDKNGALRNVAVKDAWQRLRQNVDVVNVHAHIVDRLVQCSCMLTH